MNARKVATRSTAVTIMLLIAGGIHVQQRAASRWQDMQAWAKTAEQTWAAHDGSRQPLWGEGQAGSAFAAYDEVADALNGSFTAEDQRLLRQMRTHPETLAAEQADALLARWRPFVAAMRIGAHRLDARRPMTWSQGWSMHVHNLLALRELVNVSVIEASRMRAAGELRQATELLLDAATFGADLVRSPLLIDQMIGQALVTIAISEAFGDDDLRALDDDAAKLLAEGLRRLDDQLPLCPDLQSEALCLANQALHHWQTMTVDGAGQLPMVAWNYGFSARWAVADAVLLAAGAFARLAAGSQRPWSERQEQHRSELDALLATNNPVLQVVVPNLLSAERCAREVVTRVRLLRLAVHQRLGGELPALADPLGEGLLRTVPAQGEVVFRSAGERSGKAIERRVAIE